MSKKQSENLAKSLAETLTTYEIKKLIESLRTAKRCTGFNYFSLSIDDIPYVYVETPEEQDSLYDSRGISYETSLYGGVRIKSVEDLVNSWISQGGDKALVAKKQAEWYCFLEPVKAYGVNTRNQIQANQERLWMSSIHAGNYIDQFYEMRGQFVHRDTGEELFRNLTPAEYFSGKYSRVQSRLVRPIPGHVVVAEGNSSSITNPKWEEDFLKDIPKFVLRKMEYELEHLNDFNPYGKK
jgi:hypothetical protein